MVNKRIFWIGLIVVSSLLLVYSKQVNSKKAPSVAKSTTMARIPKVAPDFVVQDVVLGTPIQLSKYQGSIIILNFWATWCPPCRKEIPDFIALQNEYGKQGLKVLGLSMDDGPEKVVNYIQANGINYPIGMGSAKLVDLFGGIQGIPTTFILNHKLEIVEKWVGLRTKSEFETVIKSLLSAK